MLLVKASEYDTPIQFYKMGDPEPPSAENGWQITPGKPVKHKLIWCRVESVFREQLEAYVSGLTINRNRVRLYTRMRDDIDSTMTFNYKGQEYAVTLYGPYRGEFQLFGEVSEDGGY